MIETRQAVAWIGDAVLDSLVHADESPLLLWDGFARLRRCLEFGLSL